MTKNQRQFLEHRMSLDSMEEKALYWFLLLSLLLQITPSVVHCSLHHHTVKKSLIESGTNVRLCTGKHSASPFISGDYLTEHDSQSRVTVFDVEVLHGIKLGHATKDSDAEPIVNMLMFMESATSIEWSQWQGWGAGVMSDHWKRIKLKCTFLPGSGMSARFYDEDAVVWSSNGVTVDYGEKYGVYFMNVHCPLPAHADHELMRMATFHVVLSLQESDSSSILHLEPLPVCRYQGLKWRKKRKRLTGRETGSRGIEEVGEAEEAEAEEEAEEVGTGGSDSKSGGRRRRLQAFSKRLRYNRESGSGGVANDVAPGGVGAVEVAPKRNVSVSICVRPYHDHNLFDTRRSTHSHERLVEFLDYHFLIGVSHVYFYDRFGTEMMPLLKEYIDRGLVIHFPFPEWSEVYYRKEKYHGRAKYPYLFPMVYDQVINIEACLMEGRRNGDDWMLFIDTDEFLWQPKPEAGWLPDHLERVREAHEARLPEVSATSITFHRVNFFGADQSGELVLRSSVDRCESPSILVFKDGKGREVHEKKGKVAARPLVMIGAHILVHDTVGVSDNQRIYVSMDSMRINHYGTASKSQLAGIREGDRICAKVNHPEVPVSTTVKDTSLFWAADLIEQCNDPESCSKFTSGECGRLCLE